MIGGLKHAIKLLRGIDTSNIKLLIKCDGLEVVRALYRKDFKPSTNLVHFDLTSMYTIIYSFDGEIVFSNILGYQDKIKGLRKLSV